MAAWEFTATDLLFPIAVVALWGGIFLLMVFISRYAAHEHDGEAQAEVKREERAQAASAAASSTMTPLPS